MKSVKFVSIVFVGILIASCQPPVVFGEPQPVGAKSLSRIPDPYHGIYWCQVDSASLYIDDKVFLRRKEFLMKTTKNEIETSSDLELVNDQLYVNDWEGFFPITEKGDTIISQIILRDTIFAIGPEQILRPFKGHLVLNTKLDGDAWEVFVVSHKNRGLLTLARADMPDNIAQLDSITQVRMLSENDSVATQIYITPTMDEFEQILQQGLLFDGSCKEFERIFPMKELIY